MTVTHGWKTRPWVIIGLAMLTGTAGGLGAILFRLMIGWMRDIFRGGWHLVTQAPHWTIVILPALGLLLVSLISQYLAREVKGHGVPQILEALALRGGRIRPRVGVFGIMAPAITIGSGGSVGREGPIALIGAAFGSTVGQLLDLPDQTISLLLACGAAAGIGATFNAPIAGGFFGLEVILGTYTLGAMVPVFLASVIGVTIFTAIMGGGAVLATPPYHVVNHAAVLFMLGLGVLGAFAGYAYTRGLYGIETLFDRLPLPFWAQALLGGSLVGLIGLVWPQVLGVGYATMHNALLGHFTLSVLVALLLAKYAATLLTIGAGGSGGVFAPSLFLGGMLGGAYGDLLHAWNPTWAPHPAIYAVAGMATLFASAAQAPFVAITILLEITGDYHLTAPVIAAAAVSYFVYAALTRDSMYTVKLSQRGIKILRGNDVRPIEAISVMTALQSDVPTIRSSESVRNAYRLAQLSEAGLLPVLDAAGTCRGLVTLTDLARPVAENRWDDPVESVVMPVTVTLSPDSTLDEAIRLIALLGLPALPVSRPGQPFVGLVTPYNVMQAYHRSTLHTIDTASKVRDIRHTTGDEGTFLQVRLSKTSPSVGMSLKSVKLPSEAIMVSILRDGITIIPHGETQLVPEDTLLVFCSPPSQADRVRAFFEGTTASSS